MSQDRALQEAVLAELGWEPSVNAGHVGVSADGGVVTLTGHVENCLQKRTAEKAAARVRGVRAVVDALRVRLPMPLHYGDEEVAKAALNRLDWEADVPADCVQVTVENGWVTLSGRVEWRYQYEAAERILRGMSGVVGLQNEITIKPHPLAPDVAAEIDAALHRSRFDPTTMSVTTNGGTVTLTGTVATLADSYVACQTAWRAPGATAVQNDLVVA